MNRVVIFPIVIRFRQTRSIMESCILMRSTVALELRLVAKLHQVSQSIAEHVDITGKLTKGWTDFAPRVEICIEEWNLMLRCLEKLHSIRYTASEKGK
ncbi:MAG TPA: hypothetical protein VKR42_04985 [Ktedonobacteraceae bacterium]|nr:hypothetical protein [Ktedonobacteraceae bacterium]